MEIQLKNSITMRGDSLYCPLALSLDSYGNCLVDCHHCYLRNLNQVWGEDLKPLDLKLFEKKLINGLKNKNPQTPVAYALSQKKTIRWGNKADPFQPIEKQYKLAPDIFTILTNLDWSFVIQTHFPDVLMNYTESINKANKKKLITIMPVMSPGLDKDWEIFEKKITPVPETRLKLAQEWLKIGIPVGFNGEPYIPGFHTIQDFEDTLKLLKQYKIPSYNTYNFHFNAFVAKRLHAIGIDIEKIWTFNQDNKWRKILPKLLDLGKKYGIKIGCPDFVNSGINYIDPANTCCGINVPNPCTFNTHFFKKDLQKKIPLKDILNQNWDGTGNWEEGQQIIYGTCKNKFNLNDIL